MAVFTTRNIVHSLLLCAFFSMTSSCNNTNNSPSPTSPAPAAPSAPAPTGSPAGGATNPTAGLWVTLQMDNETFRAVATRTDTINEVTHQVRIGNTENLRVMGQVLKGGQFNPSWSWHLDSQNFFYTNTTRSDCSAKPSGVEADVDKWIKTISWYCPQGATIIEVKDCRTGTCAPFILPEEKLAARLVELKTQIQALTNDKSCSDNSQCRSIAMGNKACGGPEGYQIYSTKNTNPVALTVLVSEYNRVDKQLDAILRQPSDCRYITQPVLSCVNNQCTATTSEQP
jgi:hypothetical protein